MLKYIYLLRVYFKQEAHGPRFAHLSDIATADMKRLGNIFQILSSQLMKIQYKFREGYIVRAPR